MRSTDPKAPQLKFRPPKSYGWIGGAGITLGLLMVAVAIYDRVVLGGAGSLPSALCVLALFGTTGGYLIALRRWSYVEVNEHDLVQRGVTICRRISWANIHLVQWKYPGTCVVLRTPTHTMTIDPARSVENADSLTLIRSLREKTKLADHRNWAEYEQSTVLSIQLRNNSRTQMNEETHIWSTRNRIDRYMGLLSLLFLAVGLAAAIMVQQWRLAFAAIPVIGLWMLLRFSIPRAGQAQPRLQSSPEFKYLLRIVFLSIAGVAAIPVAQQLNATPPIIVAIAVTWFASILWVAFRADREKLRRIREQARKAARDRSI